MLEDLFINHFVPSVERYCTKKGIPFKVLLEVDNASEHPSQLGGFYPNVKVVYLPPNTAAFLQPMELGVIASFKAYYLRRTIAIGISGNWNKEGLDSEEHLEALQYPWCCKEHCSFLERGEGYKHEWCLEETMSSICEWLPWDWEESWPRY